MNWRSLRLGGGKARTPEGSGFPVRRRWWTALMGVVLALGLVVGAALKGRAHDGPEHEIEELTRIIEDGRDSAEIRIERAIEYAVLGKYAEAQRDLEQALRLDPGSLHALRELARIQSLGGRREEALATLARALRLPVEEAVDRAGLLVLRAEVLRNQAQWRPALDDCDAAIGLHADNPEWYLLRSDLHRRLRLGKERIAGVEEGLRRTGAGVLVIERIEALLDDGQYRAALQAIEPELASSRLQARWLIRRGRARAGLGQRESGEQDLRAGLAQIGLLLDPLHPDPTVLLDQATAFALLGDADAVKRCEELAREKGGDPAIVERIAALRRQAKEPARDKDKDKDNDKAKPKAKAKARKPAQP